MKTPTPPNIWFISQRVLRSVVQVGVPAFLSFALALPAIIDALGLPVNSRLRLSLLAVAAGVTAVGAAITRVMAIPAVNGWLTQVGLGSVPKSSLTTSPDTGAVQVAADPKAVK